MKKNRVTKDSYNKNASKFKDKFDNFDQYVTMINRFCDLLPIDVKLADIGCGPGTNSRIVKQRCPDAEIICIDSSEKMAEMASSELPFADVFNCDVLSFEYENLDAALLSFIIVHLNYDEVVELLKKVVSSLNNEGLMYISFMSGKKSGFEKTSFSGEDKIWFEYHEPSDMKKLLENLGCSVVLEEVSLYEETDGSSTADNFLIFKKL